MNTAAFEIPKYVKMDKPTKKYKINFGLEIWIDSENEDAAVENGFDMITKDLYNRFSKEQVEQSDFYKKCFARVEEIKKRK